MPKIVIDTKRARTAFQENRGLAMVASMMDSWTRDENTCYEHKHQADKIRIKQLTNMIHDLQEELSGLQDLNHNLIEERIDLEQQIDEKDARILFLEQMNSDLTFALSQHINRTFT